MKYDMADKWLKNRMQMPTALSSKGLEGVAPAIKAMSFFSSRVAQGHVLDRLREVSDAYTRGELDLATARMKLKNAFGTKYEPGSAEDSQMERLCSTARLNLILRQNARMAMAVGEYQQGMDEDMMAMFPYWRYVASTSASPRSEHQKYAGKVFSKEDKIWQHIFPPWDFNCKCSVEEVAADEVEPEEVEPHPEWDDEKDAPKSGYVFNPADALGTYDPSLIKDEELQSKVIDDMKEKFGCMERNDGRLEIPDALPEKKPVSQMEVKEERKSSNNVKSDVETENQSSAQPDALSKGRKELDKHLMEGADYIPQQKGKNNAKAIKDSKKIVEENASSPQYSVEEQKFSRIDGIDEKSIGKNAIESFTPGPMRNTLAITLKETQKICEQAGIPGFRGIVRVPVGEGENWNWVDIANTGNGILCLNEKRLYNLFMDRKKSKECIYSNFLGASRIRCIVLHEIGHQVYQRLFNGKKNESLLQEIERLFNEQNGEHRYFSCGTIREWFAENFCAWKMDESLMDNHKMKAIFRKVFNNKESE